MNFSNFFSVTCLDLVSDISELSGES